MNLTTICLDVAKASYSYGEIVRIAQKGLRCVRFSRYKQCESNVGTGYQVARVQMGFDNVAVSIFTSSR